MTCIFKSNKRLKTDLEPGNDAMMMLAQPTESGHISIRMRGVTDFKDKDGKKLELLTVMPVVDCLRLVKHLKALCDEAELSAVDRVLKSVKDVFSPSEEG